MHSGLTFLSNHHFLGRPFRQNCNCVLKEKHLELINLCLAEMNAYLKLETFLRNYRPSSSNREYSQGIIVEDLEAGVLEGLLVCRQVIAAELNDDLRDSSDRKSVQLIQNTRRLQHH